MKSQLLQEEEEKDEKTPHPPNNKQIWIVTSTNVLASSHKQEEGSSLIPKMELTITHQHTNNTWSTFLQNVGIEWKTGYPLFPGSFLPYLLTKRGKPANIQTIEKHPKFIISQKNMGRKGGRWIKKIV